MIITRLSFRQSKTVLINLFSNMSLSDSYLLTGNDIGDENNESLLKSEESLLESHRSLKVNVEHIPKKRPDQVQEKKSKHKPAAKPQPESKIKPRYFTAGKNITTKNERNLFDEASPFLYPKPTEELAHKMMTKSYNSQQRVKELAVKYNRKHNYRTRQKVDLLNRLFVEEPQINGLQMIQDIDPDFFSIIEGRPIKEKLNVKEYIDTVREVLRTKIVTGYRKDDVLLIEENILLEQKMIDKITADFQMYSNAFEEFLFTNHTESMKMLNASEQEALLAEERYEEYKQLSREYGALRSILYNTEEKWRNCKLYQRFLYLVSPISWRKQFDFHYEAEELTNRVQEVGSIFGKYRLHVEGSVFSLEDLINQFRDDCLVEEEPKLYFEDPNQLLDVFRFIELQNLNSLLHAEELAIPLEQVKEGMMCAERAFNAEISTLQENIDKLAGGILWEENRAKYLEELTKELVRGEFRNLIVQEDILNLHVFVEDVYETRIAPNDANLTVGEMMKAVETRFREELMKLDSIPAEQIAKLEIDYYHQEARTMKKAERAARKLLEFETCFDKLSKVFSPSHRPYYGKELKWRSPPVNIVKPPPPPPKPLTAEEIEYLTFFTQYCKYTDDIKDFEIKVEEVQDVKEKSATRKYLEEMQLKSDNKPT